MAKTKNQLLGLYDNQNFKGVHEILNNYFISNDPLPLNDLLFIYEDTEDEELINKISSILTVRFSEIILELITRYQKATSKYSKSVLMSVIKSDLTSQNINFLIEHWLQKEDHRNEIMGCLMKDPESTLLGLSAYIEFHPISFDQEEMIIHHFLMQIDPKLFYQNAADLGYMKICDLFYSIPPESRKKIELLKPPKEKKTS